LEGEYLRSTSGHKETDTHEGQRDDWSDLSAAEFVSAARRSLHENRDQALAGVVDAGRPQHEHVGKAVVSYSSSSDGDDDDVVDGSVELTIEDLTDAALHSSDTLEAFVVESLSADNVLEPTPSLPSSLKDRGTYAPLPSRVPQANDARAPTMTSESSRRQMAVQELVDTERNYVWVLRIIATGFGVPLSNSEMPMYRLAGTFVCVESLILLHSRFLVALEGEGDAVRNACRFIGECSSQLEDLYGQYICDVADSISFLSQVEQQPRLAKILDDAKRAIEQRFSLKQLLNVSPFVCFCLLFCAFWRQLLNAVAQSCLASFCTSAKGVSA
jgi:hypothetical protein